MLEAFQARVNTFFNFSNKRLLIAVSGGLDSMVLAHLCLESGFDIELAHCNFQLRELESDGDAKFVKQWASRNTVKLHLKVFKTKAYAKKNKRSTQMAARELRYTWFDELLEKEGLDYVLTAHHANDSVETNLINWSRGSGLKGLLGIPKKNDKIMRPLLRFSRKQLEQYALDTNIQWREDSSNASDDYLRNALRNKVIPAFEKEVPYLITNVLNTQEYLQQSHQLLSVYKEELQRQLMYPINQLIGPQIQCIDLAKLEEHKYPEAVLYLLLQDYGFTNWKDVYALRTAQSGKVVFSENHQLAKDRDSLQLTERSTGKTTIAYTIAENTSQVSGDFGKLLLESTKTMESVVTNTVYIDKNLVKFPLTIRKWRAGDYFYPFGMKGKKKISKFLKDEKVSLVIKDNIWLLSTSDEIVWIIGHRLDDRFKVTKQTQDILKITHSL